jgi:hypothetical protein
MSRVLAIHGVSSAPIDRGRFGFRNLSSARQLAQLLSSAERFVPLLDALADRGDALTIDDATRAGMEAALLARRYGHAVTLFVNPGQIELGEPYAFVALNGLLDCLDGEPKEFEETRFQTSTFAERQMLRSAIKATLRAMTSEPPRLALVRTLADRWHVGALDVPLHFSTLTARDLTALLDAGVDLQNHGWFHSDHSRLTAEDSEAEIRNARSWLQRQLGVDAQYFAAPFGETLPPAVPAACDVWLTLTHTVAAGWVKPRVFNRETLQGA